MSRSGAVSSGAHLVHLYRDDAALVRSVVAALGPSLRRGGPAIVIALPEHRAAIEAALYAHGVDVTSALESERLVCRDAAGLAAALLVGGTIDRARFDATVGSLVREVVASQGPVSVYGEIVSVLWAGGHVVAALELEALWNVLLAELPVTLLCGYPAEMAGADEVDGYQRICAAHTDVVDAPPAAPHADRSRLFPGTVPAVRLARRFVADSLHAWDLDHLVPTAELVAGELASNAVEHSGSDFSVSLVRSGQGISLAVGDRHVVPKTPELTDAVDGGWGLRLVEALCTGWGYRMRPNGKLVWAILQSASRR